MCIFNDSCDPTLGPDNGLLQACDALFTCNKCTTDWCAKDDTIVCTSCQEQVCTGCIDVQDDTKCTSCSAPRRSGRQRQPTKFFRPS